MHDSTCEQIEPKATGRRRGAVRDRQRADLVPTTANLLADYRRSPGSRCAQFCATVPSAGPPVTGSREISPKILTKSRTGFSGCRRPAHGRVRAVPDGRGRPMVAPGTAAGYPGAPASCASRNRSGSRSTAGAGEKVVIVRRVSRPARGHPARPAQPGNRASVTHCPAPAAGISFCQHHRPGPTFNPAEADFLALSAGPARRMWLRPPRPTLFRCRSKKMATPHSRLSR
jgi:hypothetical protein